ncbi:MAG TPA: 50S ribosomal protein L31 [Candidatus Paceibacterota bacterium]
MKLDTHPTYHDKARITCACGNAFTTGSTQESISIEICSVCHPFFTGTEKIIDAAGRVERFKARRAAAGKTKKAS